MLNTELKNRTLWFDGSSSYDPSLLSRVARMYDIKYVDYIDKSVREYNAVVSKEQELSVKNKCDPLSHSWNIPDEYKNLDVLEYVAENHLLMTASMDPTEAYARDMRIATELNLFEQHGFTAVLRTIIFIINKLSSIDAVWGVGRGSSVSSYVLYVIGVHDVDSFLYDLEITDFISG